MTPLNLNEWREAMRERIIKLGFEIVDNRKVSRGTHLIITENEYIRLAAAIETATLKLIEGLLPERKNMSSNIPDRNGEEIGWAP